jgi:hypothetical protein
MGTPTTWCDCSLCSAALERTELMVRKCANRFRAFPSTASSHRSLDVSRRLAGGVRCVPF